MVDYYIFGGSIYNNPACKVYLYADLGGYPESEFFAEPRTKDDGDMFEEDPYWRLGGASGGQKEAEIGLHDSYRISIDDTGIYGWDEGETAWVNLLTGILGTDDLDDICERGAETDVVDVTFTGANNEANSVKIGNGTVECKIWSDGTDIFIKSSSGDIILIPTGGDVKCPDTEKIWDACYN